MSKINRQWVLSSNPTGIPSVDNWKIKEAEIPKPKEEQVLARSIYLSLDPYMRGCISAAANYAAGVGIGDCMYGGLWLRLLKVITLITRLVILSRI